MSRTVTCTDRRRLGRYERDRDAGPRCEHPPSGTLGYPAAPSLAPDTVPVASAHVCDRADCQADVAAWVRVRTGHDAVFSTFAENRERSQARNVR